jgi:hypothetical protein
MRFGTRYSRQDLWVREVQRSIWSFMSTSPRLPRSPGAQSRLQTEFYAEAICQDRRFSRGSSGAPRRPRGNWGRCPILPCFAVSIAQRSSNRSQVHLRSRCARAPAQSRAANAGLGASSELPGFVPLSSRVRPGNPLPAPSPPRISVLASPNPPCAPESKCL